MKYIKKILLLLLFILIPFNTFALSEDYTDKVGEIVSKEVEKGKVNIYFVCEFLLIIWSLLCLLFNSVDIYWTSVSGYSSDSYC